MTNVEQSYQAAGIDARTRWQLIVLAAGLFVVGTNAYVIAGVLPEIAADLRSGVAAVSYSITWYSIVVAVASPVIASLLPRLSRTALMASGLGIVAIGTVITAAAPTLDVFFLGRIVAAIGGAALVPAATAAAPSFVAVALRGRALATVGAGFTLATAIGSPLGTALASIGGWRLPLGCLAGLAAIFAALIALSVRGIPTHGGLRLADRFAVFGNWRIDLLLLVQILFTAAFNVVYIFSATAMRPATGGAGSWLALLLLLYGVGGVLGNWLGGRLTDRIGAIRTGAGSLILTAVVVALLIPFGTGLVGAGILFALWGIVAFAGVVPIQHQVVALESRVAGISLSWLSTAIYVGVAAAPILGAAVLGAGTAPLFLVSATLSVAGCIALLLTLIGRRRALGTLEA